MYVLWVLEKVVSGEEICHWNCHVTAVVAGGMLAPMATTRIGAKIVTPTPDNLPINFF